MYKGAKKKCYRLPQETLADLPGVGLRTLENNFESGKATLQQKH